ncbi:uncharacterized protein LOC111282863 isoform X3 [Durio zibethinus]|uniref:Uncharacterized protein LOC111282863 isoform X3 n=1 Tax=Durio zibethinus TaxID=66656 RepID=A0A6P5XEZ7_DURZI|nr:uncharacterized protein LOC111282863 isoform X3 [Durio zibethinus]
MAMQTGVGLSKILILVGAGYTGTILLNNGKLSDILGQLQSLVKGLEKSGEQSDDSDAILAQVRRLSTEIRQLASVRQITVLNGDSGGKLTSLVIPAATLGALGYGYMWWKGISFSDLFWVTKRNMAMAVENLTKHLDSVSDALSVEEARMNLSNIEYDLDALQRMISGLDGKIGSLEYKQDLANAGVWYLCNMVGGKKAKMPESLQEQLKHSGRSRALLTHSGTPTLKGLKDVADILSGSMNDSGRDAIMQDGIYNLVEEPRSLQRSTSAMC